MVYAKIMFWIILLENKTITNAMTDNTKADREEIFPRVLSEYLFNGLKRSSETCVAAAFITDCEEPMIAAKIAAMKIPLNIEGIVKLINLGRDSEAGILKSELLFIPIITGNKLSANKIKKEIMHAFLAIFWFLEA